MGDFERCLAASEQPQSLAPLSDHQTNLAPCSTVSGANSASISR
jgi:hypothetical protein